MASADELKALGNKAIAEKNFDDAVYVTVASSTTSACQFLPSEIFFSVTEADQSVPS
jgi:hypothetical protein